jgi:hypothetical protein
MNNITLMKNNIWKNSINIISTEFDPCAWLNYQHRRFKDLNNLGKLNMRFFLIKTSYVSCAYRGWLYICWGKPPSRGKSKDKDMKNDE